MCAIWSQLAQLRRELVQGEEFPRGRRLVGGPPPDRLGFPVIQVFGGVAASRAARAEEPGARTREGCQVGPKHASWLMHSYVNTAS
jgi:hypothetical protein